MQDIELRVHRVLDHAAREHGRREIVTRWADGRETRTTWAGIAHDSKRLAQALERLGIRPGDRVATLAMNHAAHLVAWYGTIGSAIERDDRLKIAGVITASAWSSWLRWV